MKIWYLFENDASEVPFCVYFRGFSFHSMLISAVLRPQNEDLGNSKKTFTKNPLGRSVLQSIDPFIQNLDASHQFIKRQRLSEDH